MAFTGSAWGRRVKLTGLSPSASLGGFVALVSLDNIPVEAIDAGADSALNGGGDLRFSTDDAGSTQLPLEVVDYITSATPGSRKCQLWIRFSSYASGTREVYMFYKKTGETQPAVTDTFGRNAVFQDYTVATHLDTLVDSSGNQSDFTAANSPVERTAGIIGTDYDIDPSSAHLFTDGVGVVEDDSFNMSVWVEVHSDAHPLTSYVLSIANSADAFDNYSLVLSRSGSDLMIGVFDRNTSAVIDTVTSITSFPASGRLYFTANQSSSGTDVIAVHNGTTYTGSSNRRLQGSGFNRVGVGAILDSSPSYSINMYIDNPTITSAGVTKTQDLVESEFDNQDAPDTFWTTGTPETPGGGGGRIMGSLARNGGLAGLGGLAGHGGGLAG